MNKSEPNGGEFTVIRKNRCDRPLQPLPLEEPVEEHAVQVVSERRHTQVVMDESGKGGGGGDSRQNVEKFFLRVCYSPKATPLPVLQSHEQQFSG